MQLTPLMCLCLCAAGVTVLKGTATAAPDSTLSHPAAVDIVKGISEACAEAARGEIERQLIAARNQSLADTSSAQQQTVQETLAALQRILQEIWRGRCCAQESPAAARTPEDGECPFGWSRHKNSCYFVTLQKTSWYLAHHSCASQQRGARLASVRLDSSQFIEALGAPDVWLDLVRLNDDGVFVWSDASPLDYTNWSQDQPNNMNKNENCGLMELK
ncbi:low affinity immunoglobulin epsilon Fc receptor-like [Amphibalanus amphitrite]|uniref:low affinity immunoglobulin epsilon Fc receptor-like n=1 Tax=Amphibalanus amphitrite TaxID=1232801 RepID=UPI001C9046B6|nr:low affinity immunoglobulin epsilon Fc receptor-like [Amphibalanus amphitrite]